jgi:hypothetical protein
LPKKLIQNRFNLGFGFLYGLYSTTQEKDPLKLTSSFSLTDWRQVIGQAPARCAARDYLIMVSTSLISKPVDCFFFVASPLG